MRLIRQQLIDNNITICDENDSSPKVYQDGKLLKVYEHVSKHKYGKNYINYLIAIKLNDKYMTISYSNVIYCYFKGDILDDYDIDHIDDNTSNNAISNLQMITREDNINKRLCNGANQYYNTNTISEEELNMLKEHTQKMKEVKAEIIKYRMLIEEENEYLRKLKETWHNNIEIYNKLVEDKRKYLKK